MRTITGFNNKMAINPTRYLLPYVGKNSGWVLVDALIALLILSIALTAIAMALGQSSRGILTINNQTVAAAYARQLISQQRTYEGKGLIGTPDWPNHAPGLTSYPLAGYLIDPNSLIKFSYQIKALTTAGTNRTPSGDAINHNALEANVIPVMITITWTEKGLPGIFQVVTYYQF